MKLYQLIFEREIEKNPSKERDDTLLSQSNIALFFSGLFRSYQDLAFESKKEFLKPDGVCFQMLEMRKEIMLSLSGFMLCMLPILEE